MVFEDLHYYGDDFRFHFGNVTVEDGVIVKLEERDAKEAKRERLLLPGMIELHEHGNSGVDFSDDGYDGLLKMARFHAKHGTTGFAPASMTVSEEALATAYRAAVRLRDESPRDGARILGINMEGPFFSYGKRGAQDPRFLRDPDLEMFARLQEIADGMIRLVSVAPELPGADAFIQTLSQQGVVVSVAHTEADYATASRAFALGARHVTHLYNGMLPFLHRAPGVVGAAMDNDAVNVELIGDGLHVQPPMVRAVFRMFGAERVCLITDALSFCGMNAGEYMQGGRKIILENGLAKLEDGTIAGSTATLLYCVKNVTNMGIPMEQVIRTATANPAKVLGVWNEVGSISVGKRADLLLCDGALDLKEVYLSGRAL